LKLRVSATMVVPGFDHGEQGGGVVNRQANGKQNLVRSVRRITPLADDTRDACIDQHDVGRVAGYDARHLIEYAVDHFVEIERAAQRRGSCAECLGQHPLVALGFFRRFALGDVARLGQPSYRHTDHPPFDSRHDRASLRR
jgi:hypothetical protein